MITIKGDPNSNNPLEIYGLSTDTKPVVRENGKDMVNGSSFIEMDTSKLYFFNGESKTWEAWS